MPPETFDLRRAKPGQRFGYTERNGQQHELVADADGVIEPMSREDVAILDGFGLPVARKAIAEREEEAPATTKPSKAASPAEKDGGS